MEPVLNTPDDELELQHYQLALNASMEPVLNTPDDTPYPQDAIDTARGFNGAGVEHTG